MGTTVGTRGSERSGRTAATASPSVGRLAALLVLVTAIGADPAGAVTLAAGDLLVVDANNERLLVVRPSTGEVTHLSPTPGVFETLFDAPTSVVATDQGHVYVVDAGLRAIVEVDPATGEQALLLRPDGTPVEASGGIDADAFGVL